jgi:hypothetical protein
MLKKYTKYAATAFAVASLSTFMIGCGEAADDGSNDPPPEENEGEEIPEEEGGEGEEGEGEE